MLKKIKKLSLWGVLKQMMKAGMLICLIFVGMRVGGMYVDYKQDNPEGGVIDFVTHQEQDVYDKFYEKPDPAFVEKVRLFNETLRVVWFSLFFFVMFEIFDYKDNPKEHWSRIITDRLKKIKLED